MRRRKLKIFVASIVLPFILVSNVVTANSEKLNSSRTNAYDLSNPDVQMKLAFVHTVLLQTRQKHSHQLNGETENEYFIRKRDGAEAVFDQHGMLVTNCVNKSVANLENPLENPLAHFSMDVWPWLKNGKCNTPKTTTNQRVDAYIRDLRDSITLTAITGGGFHLPENPNLMTKNFKGFFLFVTQLERRGFKVKDFMQFGIARVERRELFLAMIRNVILSELAGLNS